MFCGYPLKPKILINTQFKIIIYLLVSNIMPNKVNRITMTKYKDTVIYKNRLPMTINKEVFDLSLS